MDWLNAGISPIKELIAFLHKKSKTNDVQKKQIIVELRDNLNILYNGFKNNSPHDTIIDLLQNQAIQDAMKGGFAFHKLKSGEILSTQIRDERNKRYIGWDAEKLIDKIDEKIVELRNIKRLNSGTVINTKNNISMMLANLYYRMKLLADFIKSED